ncbi:MAG: 2-C-methyl-D-erythritol 2,4-cyclodiphosphate synthase, partial [Oxalobacteraceae bacterium]|nr:2-C-methyl-D-erythritol 2,4-cyclodiphosphate synthase [Oxalobacteraceae bacterium]
MSMPPYRIGQGYDCHALVPSRPLIIGGVTIPHTSGLLGHSDADVLLHAITDALLGAAGLGDIGQHFPDTDPAFKGADSRQLLRAAAQQVKASGYSIGNIDATI